MNRPVTLYYAATVLFLLIGTIESLIAVVALTFAMALRVVIVTDEMIETGVGFVTTEELVNYLIVGGIAYFSWAQGIKSLKESKISKNDDWL
jgi:hypothetical protein